MIALVEGAIRQRTPNEIALSLVLSAFTLIFLIVTVALWPMACNAELYMKDYLGVGEPVKSLGTDVPTLVALLVCLIPTTIGALLAAIGIAGMDRALRANIIAKSGKAVEVAGDVDTLLLDKTGTITIGNRQATQFVPLDGLHGRRAGPPGRPGLGRRPDAGRQEHRRAVHQKLPDGGRPAQSRRRRLPAGRALRRVHRPDAHERHRPARRPAHPQGRARRRHPPRPAAAAASVPAAAAGAGGRGRLARARRRCWSAKATGSPAWSCWKTS